MTPELILHIGAPKCGSSSIQAFLSRNRKQLRNAGYIVPDEKLELNRTVSGHHVWYLQQFRDDLERGQKEVRQCLLALREKLRSDGSGGIILSAENLSDGFGLERLFENLKDHFRIRVIVYIRRQDDFLLSSWQQWNVKRALDFWTWLLRTLAEERRGNWLFALQPWIDAFGAEAITVRRFGRQYFVANDLLTDFCACIGLDTSQLDLEVPRENSGFSDPVVKFAFALQDVFENAHDDGFYDMMRRWGGEAARKSGDSELLSVQQRHAVLYHYAESNKAIKQLFFPGDEVPDGLFDPPRNTRPGQRRASGIDPQSELLMRLIYGAYKEFGALHKFEKALDRLKQNIPGGS